MSTWDTIQPALFTRFDNYEDLIPQLKTASIERREKDEEFQSFLDKRNKLEDKFNSKLISLNLKNRLAEAKNEKELDDIFDDDYNEKNPQTNSLVKIKGLTNQI